MDALLSQLKGQGSPSTSPSKPLSNTDKLIDSIHLLSQLLVAQQLQERQQITLPTPPPTPQSSRLSSAKKTPPPKLASTPMLSWVPRAPEYYRPPSPNSSTTHTSVPTPTKSTPHTNKVRKPKSKRTKPQTQPTPSPNPTPTTPRPAQPDQQEPPITAPPSRPAQPDQRVNQTHPLPTPTPTTPSTDTDISAKAALKAKKAAIKASKKQATEERCKQSALAASSTPPTAIPQPAPPPSSYEDTTPPVAPVNAIVNFSHIYDDCPRLPECPAHRIEFAVYSQAYADRIRDAPLPSFPQPHAGPGFELWAERDTAWWPEIPEIPPSERSSPPGSPVDSDSFIPPADGFDYI